jgi:hypothetical protein
MTVDTDIQRHWETWHGFTRFIKYSVAAIVITLVALGFFLL